MPTVKYIEFDGTEHDVSVPVGESVMQGAVKNGIDGIIAECGGGCACATCHVFVDPTWTDKAGQPGELEAEMLSTAATDMEDNSRLGCQIAMTEELDGLIVRLPEDQE